jgi:hypothetical protein
MQKYPRYLRVFDVEKYREIQPTIVGIVNRSADAEQVISLLKAAKNVTKTDDFRKYNGSNNADSDAQNIQKILDVIQISGISTWFDMLDRREYSGIEILISLYSFICCPKYQSETDEEPFLSGMTIEYIDISFGKKICDLNLFNLIDCSYLPDSSHIERLPTEMKGEGVTCAIFNRQQLALITETTKGDILTLSQLDCGSDKEKIKLKNQYLEFYNCFKSLLSLVNSHPEYTFLNEEHIK